MGPRAWGRARKAVSLPIDRVRRLRPPAESIGPVNMTPAPPETRRQADAPPRPWPGPPAGATRLKPGRPETMTAAIRAENLSKLYRLGASRGPGYRTLRESIAEGVSAPWRRLRGPARGPASNEEHWALKDVSFRVQPGEVVGVIGRNGAGKSTVLKILSRITEPHSGRVELRGRVGSLLEVGVGFHHELSGRENIFLNGAICGMSRREITRKFDSIVEFAEVGPFLDTPVKRYSSGMYVRLAFAVASHMEPEILLVDEVLAVGDAAYQKKCLAKMDEVSREGRTIVLVSHNMATIMNICNRIIYLEKGRVAFEGGCEEGIGYYTRSNSEPSQAEVDLSAHPNRRSGSVPILGGVRLLDSRGRLAPRILCGESISIEIAIDPRSTVSDPHIAVGVDDSLGRRLLTAATYLSDSLPEGAGRCRRLACHLGELPLAPGRYSLTLNAGPAHSKWADMVDQALWFDVEVTNYYGNGCMPNPDWGQYLSRSRWESVG